MDEEFTEIINKKIGPIENVLTIFKKHIISEYKKHYEHIKNGYIHYVDFEIPIGYVSKYGINECIQIIKNLLKKHNRIENVCNHHFATKDVNLMIDEKLIMENEFITYTKNLNGNKIWYRYDIVGFIIPIVKDNYMEGESNIQINDNKVVNLDSIEIL